MEKRKPYFRKNGNFIRGTVVKPKYFKKKLVVDLDFDTHSTQDKSGQMTGRKNVEKGFERTAVIRLPSGELAGRTQNLSIPYPRTYPISTKHKSRIKTKRIPVIHWD